MNREAKILITGSTGAIGLEILQQLDQRDSLENVTVLARNSKKNRKKLKPFTDKIRVIYGDVTSETSIQDAVFGQDIIFHLAALIPTVEDEDHELVKRVNIIGTKNVVEAMKAVTPNAFLIFSSSVATYGDRLKDPMIKVDDELKGSEHDNYAFTKVEAENLIRNSGLNWCIYRLSAIMGIGNHKVSTMMFDMPLETPMEFATVRDTARAFINSTEHLGELKHRTFNLSGGIHCRIVYKEFIEKAFYHFGLGKVSFPKYAFATQNFHCGYFLDCDELEEILHFRSDDVESYFTEFKGSVPAAQRYLTMPFAWVVKKYLLTLSKPYKAYKKNDRDKMNHFFGE